MPVRMFLGSLLLASGVALAGCAPSVNEAYTSPGWYLELPRPLVLTYPGYVAGPFSYEECEVERLKASAPDRLLCTNRKVKPSEA